MSISVNKSVCIGCGSCAALCPSNFELGNEGKAEVISQEDSGCAQNAAQSCPVQAIKVE